MSDRKFYITTTLPYVNAPPHIGFALELVEADILARYHNLLGEEVFFNTGTDEHGVKVYRKSQEEGNDPKAYVDKYAENFRHLMEVLNISARRFVRTTDSEHMAAAQAFWKLCAKNGDIEKKLYKTKYCAGCELEKTDSELKGGRCPLHPNFEIEIIEEENYFFKFSKYQRPLLEFYAKNPDFVVPEFRFNEIRRFVDGGLNDFSISRLAAKMPWGVPVPDDPSHVMYVWFDALVSYISTLGWPKNQENFKAFWPGLQIAGKDQIRQQAAMWQAMLISAGLPKSKQIIIHGFINVGGSKISKSLGNVVDPFALVAKYGADAVRFWLAHEVQMFEDSDFTEDKFKEGYNANLANGLGNLVARIMALAEMYLPKPILQPKPGEFPKEYTAALDTYDLKKAIDFVWSRVAALDQKIADTEPFKVLKADLENGRTLLTELVVELYWIGRMLYPFMPEANVTIKKTILENKKPPTLFPRV